MPYLKIWIHLVWATKNRYPFLTKDIRKQVFDHIRENAQKNGIYLDHINGYVEHVHCLLGLKASQNIATVANLLKGESSYWINNCKLTQDKFNWQEDYFAASVSHSQVDVVRKYIRNQERHHSRKSFEEEYNEFIASYDFRKV